MIMKTVSINDRKLYNKKFFREVDVLHHIKPNDFWVILNRQVLDLSHIVKSIDELPSNSTDFTVCICLRLPLNFIQKNYFYFNAFFMFVLGVFDKHWNFFYVYLITYRHYISSVCLVARMWVNCFVNVKRTNWKCLLWNHTLNMQSWTDVFGGMIQF